MDSETTKIAPKKVATEKADPKQVASQQAGMPLGKINFILMGVCLLLIVVGFVLMSGSANEGDTFNADIFNSMRTSVGPFISFLGFVLMAFAIIYKKKDKNAEND